MLQIIILFFGDRNKCLYDDEDKCDGDAQKMQLLVGHMCFILSKTFLGSDVRQLGLLETNLMDHKRHQGYVRVKCWFVGVLAVILRKYSNFLYLYLVRKSILTVTGSKISSVL